MKRILIILFAIFLPYVSWGASTEPAFLYSINTDLSNKASLQRGAQMYTNYCMGCHSLKYVRFSQLAKDIGIVNEQGEVLTKLVMDNLIFSKATIHDTMAIAMQKQDAAKWFGVQPPDLSLVTRSRGVDWLYTYLVGFYRDPSRPWGVNNMVFYDVAMPNVLESLQGELQPIYSEESVDANGKVVSAREVESLKLVNPGSLTEEQFRVAVYDLVNFLDYVSEPVKLERQRIGLWVLGFLFIFLIIAYFLKKEFWRDVHCQT